MNIIFSLLKSITICALILSIFSVFFAEATKIIPVEIKPDKNPIFQKLKIVGIRGTNKLVDAIAFASDQSKLEPDFIIALSYTESLIRNDAVSSKGYKGEMQIPYHVPYSDANILIGARIFKEKMSIANNDVIKALCLYKGYPVGSKRGIEQANKVLKLYNKIKRSVV